MIHLGYLISIGLFIIGLILFFWFSTRKNYRDTSAASNYDSIKRKGSKHINHYKDKRDQLSLRKIEKYKPDKSFIGLNSISHIITGIIVLAITIAIGTTIMNEISNSLEQNSAAINATSASIGALSSLSNFMPLLFGLTIIVIIGSVILRVFNSSNLI